MYCNQCEQTLPGTACFAAGVCGKTPESAILQDLIVYTLRGLAVTALEAAARGIDTREAGRLCARALFTTLTNVSFDPDALRRVIDEAAGAKAALQQKAGLVAMLPVTQFSPSEKKSGLARQAGVASTEHLAADPDCNSLAQTLLYGLKGVAAYLDHAAVLGHERDELYEALFKGLATGFDGKTPALMEWVDAVLECGNTNLLAMQLLDEANTSAYGHPEPSGVALNPRPGKAILITGHDLKDLYDLLVQTEGTGIQIYTHGEMLPAHAYPALKRFSHLAGHFGTAWQNQQAEMPHFPGAILFTTNCIQRPGSEYINNVFTTGLVSWPGVRHVKNGDFAPVIERALALEGFTEEKAKAVPEKQVMTGFARHAVLGIADTIVEKVKKGEIRHFFLVGGCDGARPGRNYYTEFVEKTPDDTLVLTLACGKFRFFDRDIGHIDGIPRLLDVGQCNDAYSAIMIAKALSEAFSCEISELPLSLILSWYEQKAVAILLTLLALGIRGIRLGPTAPAFLSPAVFQMLTEQFVIRLTDSAENDIKSILGTA
ncbi:hydroxylamine reductase [Oxalobacter sp. OttesenSCG-928-P03]|nr:hydroxylamine reductase [Oxalobacter sp. OttesenSCG-928-P03]